VSKAKPVHCCGDARPVADAAAKSRDGYGGRNYESPAASWSSIDAGGTRSGIRSGVAMVSSGRKDSVMGASRRLPSRGRPARGRPLRPATAPQKGKADAVPTADTAERAKTVTASVKRTLRGIFAPCSPLMRAALDCCHRSGATAAPVARTIHSTDRRQGPHAFVNEKPRFAAGLFI
jgi:hypothetical protein